MNNDQTARLRPNGRTSAGRERHRRNVCSTAKISDETHRMLPDAYRSCLDAFSDLMAVKGSELEYIFVNKAYCDFLGKRQEEILGRRAMDLFPQDAARKLETMDLLVLASLRPSAEEVKINDRIYEIRKFPVSLQGKGLVVVSGRDITERRNAELELLTEKIRFQIMSDNAAVAMALLEKGGRIKYVNVKFKEFFGYEGEEILDGATWFKRVFPDREYEKDLRAVLSRANEVEGWNERERYVLTAVRRDGTRRIVGLEAVQLPAGDVVVSCDNVAGGATPAGRAAFRSDYDVLTGLPNRASLERAVKNAVDHAREGKRRRGLSALLLLAVQGFDDLKRDYGEQSRNEIVTTLANVLRSLLRAGDIAYRSSEERFAVIFKGVSLVEAKQAAGRLLDALTTFTFLPGNGDIRLDVATAIVQVNGRDDTVEVLSLAERTINAGVDPGGVE